jgi:hypothetical protein
VKATDISEQQISNALIHPQVEYSVQPSESTTFEDSFFDFHNNSSGETPSGSIQEQVIYSQEAATNQNQAGSKSGALGPSKDNINTI